MVNCQVEAYCAGDAVGRYLIEGRIQDRCVYHAGASGELVEAYDEDVCAWLARQATSQ